MLTTASRRNEFRNREPTMSFAPMPARRSPGVWIILGIFFLALLVRMLGFSNPLRRWIRESRVQRTDSAHYQVSYPAGAILPEALHQFLSQRESVFATLNERLGGRASSALLRIIFDPEFSPKVSGRSAAEFYSVDKLTIRTRLNGSAPVLDSAADAEAMLFAAWGKSGNPLIAQWTAVWLVGTRRGQELGMAAAEVQQKLGHTTLSNLLDQPSGNSSDRDRAILGAAWLSEVAEIAGPAQVHKLYSASLTRLDLAEVTQALGTSAPELEREWQLWIDAYIAGMPAASHSMTMPMGTPMPTGH
jgi:hypothetical protein